MKKSIFAIIICLALGGQAYAQSANNPKNTKDTVIDLSKHPEIVKAILKDPEHWSSILKVGPNDTTTVQGKHKQVIRNMIAVLVKNNIVKDRSEIKTFMLTSTSLTVNGKEQQAALQRELKARYIIEPDYVVYYGNSEKTGKGIFQRPDSL